MATPRELLAKSVSQSQISSFFIDRMGIINVKSYGAEGDGVTDSTVAIQAALDYLNSLGGGVLYFPRGTYKISDTLIIYSNITLVGADRGSTIIDASSVPTARALIKGLGTYGSSNLLVGDGIEKADTFTVTSSGLAANDDILISSTTVFETKHNNPKGEIQKIASVATSTTLTLDGGLFDTYLTSAVAKVQKLTMVKNILIENLTVTGAGTGKQHYGIWLECCKNVILRNVAVDSSNTVGLYLVDSVNISVDHCTFSNQVESGMGYGIDIAWACKNVYVSGGLIDNSWSGLAIGGGSGRPGIPRFITVEGVMINQFVNDGLNTHANADRITFKGCTITTSGLTTGGITVSCNRAIVANNTIVGSKNGIFLDISSGVKTNIIVESNLIYNIGNSTNGGVGILVLASAYNSLFGSIVITNNIVSNAYAVGIQLQSSQDYTLKGLTVANNSIHDYGATNIGIYLVKCEDATIVGNQVFSVGAAGIFATGLTDAAINNNVLISSVATNSGISLTTAGVDVSISGNRVKGFNNGILLSDDTTYCVVMGNNLRGNAVGLSAGSGTGHVYETVASDKYNIE